MDDTRLGGGGGRFLGSICSDAERVGSGGAARADSATAAVAAGEGGGGGASLTGMLATEEVRDPRRTGGGNAGATAAVVGAKGDADMGANVRLVTKPLLVASAALGAPSGAR